MKVTKNTLYNGPHLDNILVHYNYLQNSNFNYVVRPNVDTLYSSAFLDLNKGPISLFVPDTNEKYYVLELSDAWTNVFCSIGKRTTGTESGDYFISGPNSNITPPQNQTLINSPTNLVWVIIRILVKSKNDFENTVEIQKKFVLSKNFENIESISINSSISSENENRSVSESPLKTVLKMNFLNLFSEFLILLETNPINPKDDNILKMLEILGINHNGLLSLSNPEKSNLPRLATKLAKSDLQKISSLKLQLNEKNGWMFLPNNVGKYKTNYLLRAFISYHFFGACIPEDSVYAMAFKSLDGQKLSGDKKYLIHFDKDEIPPVKGFWSITLYNSKGFLVNNKFNKYSISDRDDYIKNDDGSIDFFIGEEATSNLIHGKINHSNWLPCPKGDFNLALRLYWPDERVLNGLWNPPFVRLILVKRIYSI